MTLVAPRIINDVSYVMLQCHVSNDAHRLNCHEMSGKRFHGLVTVY